MNDWLLHMTEAQRNYAAGLIDSVLHVLGSPVDLPPTRSSNWCRLFLSHLPDRRSGATVTLSRGRVFLRTPLSPRRDRFAAELVGPACAPIDVIADGDVAVILVTLVGWRAALSSPVTTGMAADVDAMALACTRLLRGVVEAHRPDWELATLQSSPEEGHVAKVFSRDAGGWQVKSRFASRPSARTDGGMTQELVDELERIGGDRTQAHVVELERWQRYRLCFHATPTYLVSPTTDAMLTLRALADLPSGAGFVTT